MMLSKNPATGQLIKQIGVFDQAQTEVCLHESQQAFAHWKEVALDTRLQKVKVLGQLLNTKKHELAKLMTLEMGKLIKESVSEIEKCVWLCDYYVEHASSHLQDEMIVTDFSRSYISYQPLGVILGIMPWNFPFWQVFRFAIPTLLAGNTALLKHASNVPQCALILEQLFNEAGFDQGVFQTLLIKGSDMAFVIEHEAVKAVSLTGSTQAGKRVAQTAGACLKKCVLELGGSDPYLIRADADLNQAIDKCVTSRLLNAGQSCIGAKRFIVERTVLDPFVEGMLERFQHRSYGDPMDKTTGLAPLATEEIRTTLHQQVSKTVELGGRCLMGGSLPDEQGYFYPPTILCDLTENMPAYHEELFGPVACVYAVDSLEEALHLANQSQFGLGAAIFSKNIQEAEHIARNYLDSGSCFVNDFVKSDPRLPFGGIKHSGFGRELSYLGIREFTNIKTVCVE